MASPRDTVEGALESLTAWLASFPSGLREEFRLFLIEALTVRYSHSQHIAWRTRHLARKAELAAGTITPAPFDSQSEADPEPEREFSGNDLSGNTDGSN